MSIKRFRPEIWSAKLLVALRKNLVYAGPGMVNRDYEGEIREAGDTVRITSISRPTIGTYVPNVTVITPEELTDAQRTLVVDQSKFWAFKVDDVDKRQAKGDVMPQAMSEASYGLADVVDQYVASLYTQAQAANQLGTISVPVANPEYFYSKIVVPLGVALDQANVPAENRWMVIPPWLYGRALLDPNFINADKSGDGGTAFRNGIVGSSGGFTIMRSNNAPNPTGDDYVVTAGNGTAISFAEQINKTEAYRPESSFSDAIKGLALYGAKVVRPEALATAIASQT
ncbi:P22 phage major capsid protein family protein [Actinacidiphila glaucinigra]|uniref:P22 phage major capsid protein family protein n=1 Tax=Actinacidiphila glaucinigra TaxID=235986 RepID=UPI0035D87712